MSRDHRGLVKAFTIHSQSWYTQSHGDRPSPNALPEGVVEEFMIGFYGDGTSGEFSMRWKRLGDEISMQLQSWSDGWSALVNMPELLMLLADLDGEPGSYKNNPTPEQFAEMLKGIGFQDQTKRNYKDSYPDEDAA